MANKNAPENYESQTEADKHAGEKIPNAVRAARKPLDFVPGEHPKQRAERLRILHGIVE